MPERMGHFHLNTIIRNASVCSSAAEMERALRNDLNDAPLRAEFITSYTMLRDAYFRQFHEEHQTNVKVFLSLNAIRLNTAIPELYRTNLYPKIDQLVLEGGDVTEFIHRIVAKAKTYLTDVKAGHADVSAWFRCPASISETQGLLVGNNIVSIDEGICSMQSSVLSDFQANRLRAVCKLAS